MTLDFDQQQITEFFNKTMEHHVARDQYMKSFSRSGYALIDNIPASARILDVGCGLNLFKPYFPNLIGIDVIGEECDIKTSLLEYRTDQKFDVVLCLGSVFGSLNDIKQQVEHIRNMLVSRGKIYWRNHHARPEFNFPGVEFPPFFYQWTEQTHLDLASEFGFTVNEVCKESKKPGVNVRDTYRIYAEWTLNN